MHQSFRQSVPVTKAPHPAPVRATISDMIAEYAPTQLTDFKVELRDGYATVTATITTNVSDVHTVSREVSLT